MCIKRLMCDRGSVTTGNGDQGNPGIGEKVDSRSEAVRTIILAVDMAPLCQERIHLTNCGVGCFGRVRLHHDKEIVCTADNSCGKQVICGK